MSNYSLLRRKNSKGITAVTAQVRITVDGKFHSESKTFSSGSDKQSETNANKWAKRRVSWLEVNGIPKPPLQEDTQHTLASLIDNYLSDYAGTVRMGNSKRMSLTRIKEYPICQMAVNALESADYVKHAKERLAAGVLPQTVNDDLVWIGVILQFGRAVHRTKPDQEELKAAKAFLRSNGMTASGKRRERLPTLEEFRKLVGYYSKTAYRKEMLQIILFSMTSSRRISETTRIRYSDNNATHKTGLVRDLKDPRHKAGNDHRFNYTDLAWSIIEYRQRIATSDIIFDHDAQAVSINFTRACRFLEIADLHLHDLRHFATSLLFLLGFSIQEVSTYTLHMSWETLKRYAHMGKAEQETIRQIYEELICLTQNL